MNLEIESLLKSALECSVFLNPLNPGLTMQELLEVGQRAGYQQGEIGDASRNIGAPRYFGVKNLLPDPQTLMSWKFFFPEEPDYRNFDAFDFVFSQLNDRVRADGAQRAQLERSLMIERAVAQGVPRHDIELAITYLCMAEYTAEKDGVLRFHGPGGVRTPLPSQQLQQTGRGQPHRKPQRARAYPIVKDIIERRTDGRPAQIEPLDAFAEQLTKLGYGMFGLWWRQTVAEVRHGDALSAPTTVTVLSGALVEGALTFVVKHAQKLNLSVFRSSTFNEDPRRWKIDALVASAASGGSDAILDPQTKARAEILIRNRQRIHAGRMLSDFPDGVQDMRPEDARDAKGTAEQVVRAVLDWLTKYPSA